MRRLAMLLVVTAASAARADVPEAVSLTATARNVARDGRCEALPQIGDRVRELDPDYYTRVFAVDPAIVGCTHVDAHVLLGGPPSLTPPVAPSGIGSAPVPTGSRKDPSIAFGLSAGITASGIALIIAADKAHEPALSSVGGLLFIVGPTTGHIYAGHTLNAGLATRAIGTLVGIVGLGLALQCIDGCSDGSSGDTGAVLFIGGGLLYIGGGLYEIARASDAAHTYNRSHGFEAAIVPTGNGLAIAGRF